MEFTFDPAKDAANIAKHGLSLAEFPRFEGEVSVILDDRYDYGETRFQVRGRIAARGYCVVIAFNHATIRLISFRRAHDKEMRRYE